MKFVLYTLKQRTMGHKNRSPLLDEVVLKITSVFITKEVTAQLQGSGHVSENRTHRFRNSACLQAVRGHHQRSMSSKWSRCPNQTGAGAGTQGIGSSSESWIRCTLSSTGRQPTLLFLPLSLSNPAAFASSAKSGLRNDTKTCLNAAVSGSKGTSLVKVYEMMK